MSVIDSLLQQLDCLLSVSIHEHLACFNLLESSRSCSRQLFVIRISIEEFVEIFQLSEQQREVFLNNSNEPAFAKSVD